MTTYSAVGDLLKGDIPLAPQYGDGTGMIQMAADQIDSQLGHIYVTPIVIADIPANRPARLLLKNINNLIASGRLIMDMALAGEDRQLQAYGASLLKEGNGLLAQLRDGGMILTGAEKIPSSAEDDTAVSISNEDSYSLVEAFYNPPTLFNGVFRQPIMPYTPRNPT